jgi:DNA-binding protein HU-beta
MMAKFVYVAFLRVRHSKVGVPPPPKPVIQRVEIPVHVDRPKKVTDYIKVRERLEELREKAKMGSEELALRLCLAIPELERNRKEGAEILQAVFEIITESLRHERNVVVSGFGTFQTKHRKARRVRNPRVASGPGAFKGVPASTRFVWKAGTNLKPVWDEVPKGRARKGTL